jgi:hypothetical protein
MQTKAAILISFVTLVAVACTSLRPVEMPPAELQRLIREKDLIKPGDRVRLVTADGAAHELRVKQVDLDRDAVTGNDEVVPLADIITVQTRKIAVGKTAALAAGLYVGIGLIVTMTILPLAILTGGF